jgi:hypothetical protein
VPLDAVTVIALVVAEQFDVALTETELLPPEPTNGVIDTPLLSPVTKPFAVTVLDGTPFVADIVDW